MPNYKLHQYFEDALEISGEKIYLKSSTGQYTYHQIYQLALSYQQTLTVAGIQKNDRVILYSSKNAECIAMMIACSICDCLYVPVSSLNPAQRAKYIIKETAARFILCDVSRYLELQKTGLSAELIHSTNEITLFSLSADKDKSPTDSDAGFILYTSGSTGTPKGVAISHAAAIAFIDWAALEFEITNKDIIASIAPFNFDLSVFDIYVSSKMSATLRLYSEEETKNALLMAQNFSIDKITTVYATPTFYTTLAHYGKLNKYNYSSLKNVLFAGEVFHLENFNNLLKYWPDKNYSNLYGPTETNVCFFYRVDLNKMNYPVFPVGDKCSYTDFLLVDENENEITENNKTGELLVGGKSLFSGYWNDSAKTSESFFYDNQQNKFYKTGDLAYKNDNGYFVYVGRKDRMIKKNGFRIEPVEIEKVMLTMPGITNVAVLYSKEKNQLICFLEGQDLTENAFLSLKQFCQNYLPSYMIPDKFVVLKSMPKTSSGKVDLQALDKDH